MAQADSKNKKLEVKNLVGLSLGFEIGMAIGYTSVKQEKIWQLKDSMSTFNCW